MFTVLELSKVIDAISRELLKRKRAKPVDKTLAEAFYKSWVLMQPAMNALRSMRAMIKNKELPVIDHDTWRHFTEQEFSYEDVKYYVIGYLRAKRRPYSEIKYAISFIENYLPDNTIDEKDLPF
jgi:hypothetical protein